MANSEPGDGAIVELNIGGKVFVTTRGTLLHPFTLNLSLNEPNFFTALLSGKFGQQRDSKGRLFIDRDGSRFARLLEILRNGKLLTPLSNITEDEVTFQPDYTEDSVIF